MKYRYYLCGKAAKSGWHACPAPSVPAAEIENYVMEKIGEIANDQLLITETLSHARHAEPAITYAEVADAFAEFNELWQHLSPHEQCRTVRHLVQGIEWNGRIGQIRIVFNPIGLATLTSRRQKEVAA